MEQDNKGNTSTFVSFEQQVAAAVASATNDPAKTAEYMEEWRKEGDLTHPKDVVVFKTKN